MPVQKQGQNWLQTRNNPIRTLFSEEATSCSLAGEIVKMSVVSKLTKIWTSNERIHFAANEQSALTQLSQFLTRNELETVFAFVPYMTDRSKSINIT